MSTADWNRFFGWINDPGAVEETLATMSIPRLVGAAADEIASTGKGKKALLYQAVKRVVGNYQPYYTAQQIGDCVSFAFAHCVTTLMCTEITAGESEEWQGEPSTEVIYGGSRVEIGGGKIRGDGSIGAWAAKWLTDYGVLLRKKYGTIDLSRYDGRRAREYGQKGVPDVLEPVAREHPCKTASAVRSYEMARDAIYNGYPVAVCSDQGFTERRDEDGFARPSGTWMHAMAFIGMDDEYKRPGLLCCNSWGENWIGGPTRHDQPAGTFWVDAEVADRMLRQGDSFAISNFVGFPRKRLSHLLL